MRAKLESNHAETWRGAVSERLGFVETAENEADRIAAEGCLEVARRKLAFARECAAAYERIARGENP